VHCRTTTHAEIVSAVCREVLRSAPPASVILTTGDDAHRLANDPASALTPVFQAPLAGTLMPFLAA
jgi:hypothetical protein